MSNLDCILPSNEVTVSVQYPSSHYRSSELPYRSQLIFTPGSFIYPLRETALQDDGVLPVISSPL